MDKNILLHKEMTLEEFENNYWYATELKHFLKKMGVKCYNKLRKDEMENIIVEYIKNKKIVDIVTNEQNKYKIDILEKEEFVENFKNNTETWQFIINEGLKIDPQMKIKSGAKYWLNRWREKQIIEKNKIKYKDLVNEFIRLNSISEKLPQIPSTKMNNFIMDFLNNEKGSKRKDAMREWEFLKKSNIKKDYVHWKKMKKK